MKSNVLPTIYRLPRPDRPPQGPLVIMENVKFPIYGLLPRGGSNHSVEKRIFGNPCILYVSHIVSPFFLGPFFGPGVSDIENMVHVLFDMMILFGYATYWRNVL